MVTRLQKPGSQVQRQTSAIKVILHKQASQASRHPGSEVNSARQRRLAATSIGLVPEAAQCEEEIIG